MNLEYLLTILDFIFYMPDVLFQKIFYYDIFCKSIRTLLKLSVVYLWDFLIK